MMLLYFCSSFLQQDDPIDLITRNDMPPLVIVSSSSNTESPSSLKKELLNTRNSEEVVTKLHQYESYQNVDSVTSRELSSCTTTSITTTFAGGRVCTATNGSCGNFSRLMLFNGFQLQNLLLNPGLLARRQSRFGQGQGIILVSRVVQAGGVGFILLL